MAGYGVKFDGWVEQARALGLEVEIEANSGDEVLESVSARITRPQVEERNALDQYRNSQVVMLHACRCFGGRWTNSGAYWSAGASYTKFSKLSLVKYHLQSMAE